jgi:general secretion pathway protein D
MKTILTLMLAAAMVAGNFGRAEDAATNAPPAAEAVTPVAAPETPVAAPDATNAVTGSVAGPEPAASGITSNGLLRLNFRGVALDQVLTYLSEAAGFIIVLDATPRGKVDVWSNTPVTRDEAVDLLNSVLNKNGLAAIRNGRTLNIVNKDEAKTKHIPVKQGGKPEDIPNNDEMVTQILPVRFVEVAQLIKDLQPLVATATTMTANEAGNSIVMTDTQANIRRVAEIIQAIDQSAEDVTEVEVFRLQYADPTEMATLLTSVFPDESKSSGSSSPVQFGGRGGFPGFFGGGRGGGGNQGSSGSSGDQTSRIKKRSRVIAVADARTQSVIVSTASGLMDQIRNMVTQLDSNPAKKQKVYVYSLENADAQQVEQVLQEMFETTTTRNNNRNSQNQNNVLQNRANQSQTSGSSSSSSTSRTGNRTGSSLGGSGGF